MSGNLYRELIDKLKAAGFECARQNGHSTWRKKTPTGEVGVSFSRKINDPAMKRQILRSAGLKVIFASAAMIATAHAEPPPVGSLDAQIMSPYGSSIRDMKQPGTTMGCCDASDCRPVDIRMHTDKDGTHYQVFVRKYDENTESGFPGGTDRWETVPESVVIHPPERRIPIPVACWASWHVANNGFLCLTPGSGT